MVAISYYMAGLITYAVAPLHIVFPTFDAHKTVGWLVPLVILSVWLMLRRLRKNIHLTDDN